MTLKRVSERNVVFLVAFFLYYALVCSVLNYPFYFNLLFLFVRSKNFPKRRSLTVKWWIYRCVFARYFVKYSLNLQWMQSDICESDAINYRRNIFFQFSVALCFWRFYQTKGSKSEKSASYFKVFIFLRKEEASDKRF